MKTKILIFSLLIVAIFSSCQKDEILSTNNDCEELLFFENIEEYANVSNLVANMTEEELLAWEKEQGITSFGLEADRVYKSCNPENFNSIEEIKEFVSQNNKYLQLIEDKNGELELVTKLDLGVDRYLINEDKLLQIGERVYKLTENYTVSCNQSDVELLKEADDDIDLYRQSDMFNLQLKGDHLKSTSSSCEGTKILEYSTNNKKRLKFKLEVNKKLNDDVELNYYARPQKRTLWVWFRVYAKAGAKVDVTWKYYDAISSSGSSTSYGWVTKEFHDDKKSLRYTNEVSGGESYSTSYYGNDPYPRYISYTLWADTDEVSPYERSCN